MRNYTDMRKLYRFEFPVQQIFLLLPPSILCKKRIMIFLQRFHRSSLTYSRACHGLDAFASRSEPFPLMSGLHTDIQYYTLQYTSSYILASTSTSNILKYGIWWIHSASTNRSYTCILCAKILEWPLRHCAIADSTTTLVVVLASIGNPRVPFPVN